MPTLQEAVNLFLGDQKPTSAESHRYVLRDLVEHLEPARDIHDIATHHLIEYRQIIGRRPYKPATPEKYTKTIKTCFNWLVKIGLLEKSPASVLKHERLPTKQTREKAMQNDELNQVLQFTRYHPRFDAVVRFLADTGCRWGGTAGLKVEDINLDNRIAIVTEKGEKTRRVAFGETTEKTLRRWMKKRTAEMVPYVFSHDGSPMLASSIAQIVRRCCIIVGYVH